MKNSFLLKNRKIGVVLSFPSHQSGKETNGFNEYVKIMKVSCCGKEQSKDISDFGFRIEKVSRNENQKNLLEG